LLKAYRLGANSYVRKPMSFRELLAATQQIAHWLMLNERRRPAATAYNFDCTTERDACLHS
jgi:DNA-binding response OmpR family regulator